MDYSFDFFLFGLCVNTIGIVFIFIYTVIKAMGTTDEERERYVEFARKKDLYVVTYNSVFKILANKLLFLLPGYTLYLAIMFYLHVNKYDGIKAIFAGVVTLEAYSFIPLVKFTSKE